MQTYIARTPLRRSWPRLHERSVPVPAHVPSTPAAALAGPCGR